MRHVVRTGAVMLAIIMLVACAGPRTIPDDRGAAWSRLQSRLAELDRWRAEGRLVVHTDDNGGQAAFTWIETADAGFRLHLGGPWGRGAARLTVDQDGVLLTTGRGERYRGADAQRLLRELYGWEIPVDGLRQWLLGLPAGSSEFTLDRFGRLATLDWGEWRIEYSRYRQTDGLDLPAMLTARRAGDGARIRVVVDDWVLGAPREQQEPDDSAVPLIGG